MALLKDYSPSLVSLNKALLGPYFLGVNVAFGGVPLDCHDLSHTDIELEVTATDLANKSCCFCLIFGDEKLPSYNPG